MTALLIEEETVEDIMVALKDAAEFFVARDEMNAKVHLSDVRYSPITQKTLVALELVRGVL